MSIAENVNIIKNSLPESVTLIAVTKLHDVSEIKEAVSAGCTELGENKVQELLSKYDQIPGVHWHLIGHLQTNKVKQIIGKVVMIHSVDSMHLAEEIDKRAAAVGIVQDILVQVNAAGEESKFGVSPKDTLALVSEIAASCKNIRVRGLMHIAPAADDPEDVRVYFKQVKQLYDELKDKYHFDVLSMGMSNDYKVAVSEGSTAVRIGTSIFGARDYTK